MDYREHPPPPHLAGLVKTRWTLAGAGETGVWIAQWAVPDGCVEIIRRAAGRSRWDGNQPEWFAVGLIERPTGFEISGDSRFEAIRLWPWAWPLLSAGPLNAMRGRWVPYDGPGLDEAEAILSDAPEVNAIGLALIGAASVAEMALGAGMHPRTLQRWFAARVGLTPRRYLRLLRFNKAFESIEAGESLAAHAAARGFADQAHMAREFRAMAGVPANRARRGAKGPFIV